jgi:hypothetical protein
MMTLFESKILSQPRIVLSPDLLFSAVRDSIAKNVEATFRRFVTHTNATAWIIAADFAISGRERVNDAFAFSVIPYDDDLLRICSEIREASPLDLKKIRTVDDRMLALLADRRRFHFCFIPNRERHALFSLPDAREVLASAVQDAERWKPSAHRDEYIKKIRSIKQKANSNNFNNRLLHDTVIMATLSSIIAFYIAKHSNPRNISWFIDRDSMTGAFAGWAMDAMSRNFITLCEAEGVASRHVVLATATAPDTLPGEPAWYDEFVRLPDFIAGTMARWDIPLNGFRSPANKFVQIAERVVSENPHVVVMQLTSDIFGVRASVLRSFRTTGTDPAAYINSAEALLDLASFEATRHAAQGIESLSARLHGTTSLTPVALILLGWSGVLPGLADKNIFS